MTTKGYLLATDDKAIDEKIESEEFEREGILEFSRGKAMFTAMDTLDIDNIVEIIENYRNQTVKIINDRYFYLFDVERYNLEATAKV